MDDREIIDLYLARDEAAVANTAAKYGRYLRGIAYNILHNTSDSEECENDTYLAAWNKIPPAEPNSLSAFLGRIIRNIACDKYDYYTADKRNREFEVALSELSDVLADTEGADAVMDAHIIAEHISTFLNGKNRMKRIVFVRRYWYMDSVAEIAQSCGFTESKVKSMLMRMRSELKKYLEGSGINL